TRIDRWFLNNVRDIVELEKEIRACPNHRAASDDLLWRAKQAGYSDKQLTHLWNSPELEFRAYRKAKGITAVYKLVDTCAAEFAAFTPYYYSTYERPVAVVELDDAGRPTGKISHVEDDETRPAVPGKDRIMILGG